MNKSILQRILVGFKKGWSTSTLPEEKIKLHMHPLIRIFRFCGGVSVILILGHTPLKLPMFVLIIALFIAWMFGIYNIIMLYYRMKQIRFLIKSGQMDIKNSLPNPKDSNGRDGS